ncbi:unnamed protein product [Porites evermanni]|uniref:Peptidase S72 domain-containing protein n=1 Tax=Porites evermanni TaxID=104178 RepID=A0ABN8MRB9_9CNID|nr:unnamed protein product [Porites evermanni]
MTLNISVRNVFFLSIYVASSLEIQAFQPAVVPIRAITTLTLKTSVELNVASNTTLQCRFKDISVPARKEDGFIFCETPPMRNTDRVPLFLDVDGQLIKTKKPLYLHEPFKVSNVTPSLVSPAQNIHLTVSGISCQDWLQYFVRFQTANGTKKTQQGICKDSVISCYVPEFSPNTRLRVGLTLTNRLVEWADRKILIQYPIDAMKSLVKDVKTDTTAKGSFAFVVVLRDRFGNPIKVIKRDKKKPTRVLVQYAPRNKPQQMTFLKCTTTITSYGTGDEFVLSCAGAEKESIYFYPFINNVPLGGKERYEATTTLCPGKNSCEAESETPILVIVLSCLGAVLVVILLAAFVRSKAKKKITVVPEMTNELEMDVQLPKDDNGEPLEYALDNSVEDIAVASATHENVSEDEKSSGESTKLHLNVSGAIGESEQEPQGEEQKEEEDEPEKKTDVIIKTQNKNFEQGTELSAAEKFEETSGPSATTPDTDPFPGLETQTEEERPNDLQEIKSSVLIDDGLSVSIIGERVLNKSRKQADQSRKSSHRNNRVVPTDCETTAQRKYTERVKKADQYRQAWINDILGNDQSNA